MAFISVLVVYFDLKAVIVVPFVDHEIFLSCFKGDTHLKFRTIDHSTASHEIEDDILERW